MSDYTWLTVSSVGIVLLLIVLKLVFRKSLPPEITGRNYIRRQLQKRRIADADVPDTCISELVDIAISSAEIEQSAGSSFKKSFAMLLDSMIDVILLWRSTPEDTMFQPVGDEISMFREIMERNHVPVLPSGSNPVKP